jgi:hypothetical protein
MPGSILILCEVTTLIEMQETPYDSEAVLQRLLADYTNSDPPRVVDQILDYAANGVAF